MRGRSPARAAAPTLTSRVTGGTAIALLVVPGFFLLLGTANSLRFGLMGSAEVREVLVGVVGVAGLSAPSVLLFGASWRELNRPKPAEHEVGVTADQRTGVVE